MLRRPVVSPLHEGADGCWSGVENCDVVVGDDAPEAIGLRPVRSPLVHERRRAVGKNAVDHVAMPGDPADVSGAPKGVFLAKIEHIFCRHGDTEQVSPGGVKDALRLSG